MAKTTYTLSQKIASRIGEVFRRVFQPGKTASGEPPVTGALTGTLWVKITANSGAIGSNYTASVFVSPAAAAAIATGKLVRNQWEQMTDAGYTASIGGLVRLPVDAFVPVVGRAYIGGNWVYLISERNEPECP